MAILPEFSQDPDAMFLLWKDHTATKEAQIITELNQKSDMDYLACAGGTYSCEWVWAKVLHILNTNMAVASAAYSWVEHCDWITAMVIGDTTPETILRSRCAAGHKAMWHSHCGLPDEEFLGKLHPLLVPMRKRLYSDTFTCDKRAGYLSSEWTKRLGLPRDVAVAISGLDAHLGAVGACATEVILTRIIGTSTCDIMIVGSNSLEDRYLSGICGQVDGSVIPGYIGLEA